MSGAVSVRKALETYLSEMPDLLPTQWENAAYTPISGTPYQVVNILFAEPVNPEMGGMYQENGYMQITLRYPINVGAGIAQAKAQALRDYFNKGLSLTADDVVVQVNRTPAIGAAMIDGDRYAVPVKIRFFANCYR